MADYNVIVIGGGPGGYEAAFEASRQGLRVALVEKRRLGGVCLHEGCIPTKTYYHYAQMLHQMKELDGQGIDADPQIHWDTIKAYKDQVIEQLAGQLEKEVSRLGIDYYHGIGEVSSNHTVHIMNDKEEWTLTGDHIIEATGSVEVIPNIQGIEHCMTAAQLLDIDDIPDTLVIIGAGVIGMEMASIFNAFGSHVTVIEKTGMMLSSFSQDLVKRLKPTIKKQGIHIAYDCHVLSVGEDPSGRGEGRGYVVKYKKGDKVEEIKASIVLCAVGRKTPLEGQENEALEQDYPIRIGDCAGKTYLAHDAKKQGIMAIRKILGLDTVDESVKVQVAFTLPPIAETYREPKLTQGVKGTVSHFKSNGMALSEHASTGVCMVKTNELYNELAYMGIIGEQAQELIHMGVIALEQKLSVEALSMMLYAHPSLNEIMGDVFGRLQHDQ